MFFKRELTHNTRQSWAFQFSYSSTSVPRILFQLPVKESERHPTHSVLGFHITRGFGLFAINWIYRLEVAEWTNGGRISTWGQIRGGISWPYPCNGQGCCLYGYVNPILLGVRLSVRPYVDTRSYRVYKLRFHTNH